MQVDCFCFNWEEVKKRSSAEQVVDEMISTDDIDIYSTSLPDGIWNSDSASQHFEVAEALGKFTKDNYSDEYSGADILASLISEGDSIDEIGLSPLTEGCYFISLSPNRVSSINKVFNNIDLVKTK
ncbi:hypothetical protein A3197_05570 [Candidatus Thiodiazotropha endoloripes]|nr:hypothetical protein A3197_05570 [Candidatus Thiodiazotropha endoloripes]